MRMKLLIGLLILGILILAGGLVAIIAGVS